jgi:uncharacterized NAD(P)/FAD-binding protein YdhS
VPAVVVVGGGLSGTLAAAQLLERATQPLRVIIVDRTGAIGPGAAYGTRCPEHFLNVRARGMSAVAGDAEHFVRWLDQEGGDRARRWGATPDPESFAPRGLYGEYVSELLASAERAAAQGVTLERRRAEVVGLEKGRGRPRVLLDDGAALTADFVVLGLGNARPGDPEWIREPSREKPWYAPDPWAGASVEGIGREKDVLILGTNLTMIDLAVALARSGHEGTIHALSRRGLLPREHAASSFPTADPRHPVSEIATSWAVHGVSSLGALVRELRACVRRADARGLDWRMAVDALRPHTQAIWRSLPDKERRRFLVHVRPYWEIHRHRAVPANMSVVRRLLASGQLRVVAGAVREVSEEGASVRVRVRSRGSGRIEELVVARIMNATGPAPGARAVPSALMSSMVAGGLAREGPLGFGLDALPDGTLLDRDGAPAARLATLGPPLRGVLWETTAVPEIREQAASLADRILRAVSGRPET